MTYEFVEVDKRNDGHFTLFVDCDAVFSDSSLKLLREYQALVCDDESSFLGVSVCALDSALEYAITERRKDIEINEYIEELERMQYHLSHGWE